MISTSFTLILANYEAVWTVLAITSVYNFTMSSLFNFTLPSFTLILANYVAVWTVLAITSVYNFSMSSLFNLTLPVFAVTSV